MIAAMSIEVDEALRSNRFALVLRNEDTVAELEAAAALRHACNLATSVIRAHQAGEEMAGRILARAIFETWLVGLYLHFGRGEAASHLARARAAALSRWQRASNERDTQIRLMRKKLRKRNKAIASNNRHLEVWNAAHPDDLKPLEPLLAEPQQELIELRLRGANPNLVFANDSDLNYSDLVSKVHRLSAAAGEEHDPAVVYSYVYRGLSNLGAHPTVDVLDNYIDDRRGQGVFARVAREFQLASLATANAATAFLLTADLAMKVLGRRGLPATACVEGFRRYERAMPSR